MSSRPDGNTSVVSRLALPIVVLSAALFAVALHRQGHTQGDDFALYLRQARSIFDGDMAAVIADNRYSVINSDNGFSPIGYPWGWPLLLSPFVRFWGFDYDRLKLIEVVTFCVFLTLLHGVVRRRVGRATALGVAAVFATSFAYLSHTDQLLTEIPHLASVTVFVWWFDRVRAKGLLLESRALDLVMLGVIAAASFNVRREGLALIVALVAVQAFELLRGRSSSGDGESAPLQRWRRPHEIVDTVRLHVRPLITPMASFVTAVVMFQLLAPTALLPDNNNSRAFIDNRWGEFPRTLAEQLGFGSHPVVGLLVFGAAVIGAVIGVRARPHLDGILVMIALWSALTIGTHFREVERYWFQITPWVVYFASVALIAGATALVRQRERIVPLIAVAPLAALVVAHLVVLPGHISLASDYNAAGRVQSGPTNPAVAPLYEAVRELTPPDSVVAFFRARTMTLLTDRRSFQTKELDRIAIGADYLAQRRQRTAWQPEVGEAIDAGFVEVWSDPTWILWEIPKSSDDPDDELTGIEIRYEDAP